MAGYPYQAPMGLRFAAFYMGWETSVSYMSDYLSFCFSVGFFELCNPHQHKIMRPGKNELMIS